MAEHEVGLKIPKQIEILHRDIKIIVRQGGSRFGTLTISKGSIDWRPANWKKDIPLGWNEFDTAMKEANRRR
jgi:hypothetical protein